MTRRLRADVIQGSIVLASNKSLDVVIHESIDSTNSWSLQQSKQGRSLPFACLAEEQTSGRGRRGKSWLMSSQSNIAMSLCWPFDSSSQQLHLLPLSIALAIVKTLEGLRLKQVQIKWPNDVYVQGKKIAGILIETRVMQDNNVTAVIIGVGLNYDMSSFGLTLKSDAVESPAVEITDIQSEFKLQHTEQSIEHKTDREMVASMLLQNVTDVCQSFQQDAQKNLDVFRENYDFCKNKTVNVLLDDQQSLQGVVKGVSDAAELLVMVDGKECALNSAEVSVKTDT